jgi:hypothetical protein
MRRADGSHWWAVCSPHVLIGLASRGENTRISVGMLVAPGEAMKDQPFGRGKRVMVVSGLSWMNIPAMRSA